MLLQLKLSLTIPISFSFQFMVLADTCRFLFCGPSDFDLCMKQQLNTYARAHRAWLREREQILAQFYF